MGNISATCALIVTFISFAPKVAEAQGNVDVNVDVDVNVEAHVQVRGNAAGRRASRTPPRLALTLQGGLQGVAEEFSPGFGMELGAQLAFHRTRVGFVGGYHANAGIFSDSRTEVSLALEVQRVFAMDPMFRPYGFLGVGAAFASVTPESSNDPWADEPSAEGVESERRAFGRIGAGLELGNAEGFSVQMQAAALVRYAPGGSAPAAIGLGGQLNVGLRVAL